MAQYQVVEKFVSINGEGRRAGELAVFIRFKGCNLSCSYCDTKWANELNAEAEWMTEYEILEYIRDSGVKNVTLTGGEPLYREDMKVLLDVLLNESSLRVEIETNGSIDLSAYQREQENLSFTMDYKLPDSGMEQNMYAENFACLTDRDTVKFVVGSQEDLLCAAKIMEQYQLPGRVAVYLSPVFGKIHPEAIVAFMIKNHLNDVKVQLQLHKFIWKPDQRGV